MFCFVLFILPYADFTKIKPQFVPLQVVQYEYFCSFLLNFMFILNYIKWKHIIKLAMNNIQRWVKFLTAV